GNGGITALHLRDARLARTEQLRELRLAQLPLLPAKPQAVRQPPPQLHVRGLVIREAEELLRGSEPPALRFQSFLLAPTPYYATSDMGASLPLPSGCRSSRRH